MSPRRWVSQSAGTAKVHAPDGSLSVFVAAGVGGGVGGVGVGGVGVGNGIISDGVMTAGFGAPAAGTY